MKHSSFLTIASLAFVSLPFLTSCQDEDFGYTSEQISYRTNFDKMFGKASNIPTFDLSTYNLNKMGLQGGPSNGGTRASGADVYSVDSKWFYVPAGVEQWLTKNLVENKDNRTKGTKDFSLSMPSNDILLIPVYQGQAGMTWDLYVTDGKIGGESVTGATTDQKIWGKSEGIQVKKAGTGSSGITYTQKEVASQTFTHTGYTSYNNGNDKIIQLYDYLQSMHFSAATQWFKVEITNIDNNFNNVSAGLQYIHEVSGSDVWSNFPTSGSKISNNSVTFECKDEEFLRNVMKSTGDNQVKFSIWSGGGNPSNANQVNNIKITIYEKTSTGGTNDSDWQNVTALSTNENNRNTIGETIRAHAIQLKQDAFSGTFSLYLKITNLDNEYYSGHTYRDFADRHNQASTEGQMLALTELNNDFGLTTDVLAELQRVYGNEDYKFMFLGCEDANKGSVDWDMNDIVFILVGKELPEIHDKDTEVIKKRYMIEDLGSTFDFDFNDIVVDVTQVTKYSGTTVSSITQTAELKHLCGTIPFQIGFGSSSDIYWFPIMPGQNNNAEQGEDGYTPSGSSYSTMLSATGNLDRDSKHYWNPSTNNIYVRVWPNAAGITPTGNDGSWSDEQKTSFLGVLDSKTFTFPETGEYPYIIACDQTVQWMKELITIPKSWFTVSPKNDHPVYGDGDTPSQGGGQQGGGDQGGDTTPNTSLNNGSVTIASKPDGTYNQAYYTFDDNTANSLQAGDVLVITADKNNFQLVFNNDWSDGHVYSPESKGNNTYELTLTADQVTAIKANHTITFNGGNNVTISALTVRKGTSDDGGNTPIQWTGSQQYTDNNWGSSLQNLPKANFGTELGDYSGDVTVTLTAANNANVGKFKVSNTNDGNSGWDGKLSNNNDGISFTNGTCSFDVSSSNLYLLKSGQILFQTDCAFTLTSFKIEKKN